MLAKDRMEYGSRVVQVVWVEEALVHINCRVDKCITLKTKGVTNAYTTVSITYYIKLMQFKESASPERNLILAFENAA